MKLLTSPKFKLPDVFFITDRENIKKLPIGVPFIYASEDQEENIVTLLEYEILYQTALKSGYPFNFKEILKNNGYNCTTYWYTHPAYLEYVTEEMYEEDVCKNDLDNVSYTINQFIKDNSCYVDIEVLKELNVFPIWMEKIENALSTNIENFSLYNPLMYNKVLDGMYGAIELTSPKKNVVIIDISGSIPKGVSATTLLLAKHLCESFYADLLITGSKSTLYDYNEIYTLNVGEIYKENGMDNDQIYFKEILSNPKEYKTAIVFGDNHSPCQKWKNTYNSKSKTISRKDGQDLCKWKIDKLISFHTSSNILIAGYADWFVPDETDHIPDWVKYLN
jgi:hypothetical protein